LELPHVPAHAEHALEHPQDAASEGGGRRWRSRVEACGAWNNQRGRDIHGDDRLCRSLWLDVGDLDDLHKFYARDLLYHHHDLWSISTVAKRSVGDVEDLYQDIVKICKGLFLIVVLNQVPLVLWVGSGISNPWSQGGMKEMVKSVELRQKVLNHRGVCLGTQSIHEVHLLLQDVVSVDPSLWLHSQLVLKAEEVRKLPHGYLVLPPVSHPHELLGIDIKVESGIKLTDDFIVQVVLEVHHLCHLQEITSCLNVVEVGVVPSSHPIPIHPLGLDHSLFF
jgi:hypothetical protein